MERWAAAVRTALSGPRFQRACEAALASPTAAATAAAPSSDVAPGRPHAGATQVVVVADSVRAQPAGSFGWADGWPAGFLVDDLDGKPFDFTDHFEEGPSEGRRVALATAEAGWASEAYGTGGFALEKPCEPGFWCLGGVRHACPAGRYGARPHSVDPVCDGDCAAGYFCPSGSASPVAHVCAARGGHSNVYCPAGSGAPVAVPRGFYSYGDGGGGTKRFAKPFALVDADRDGRVDWLEFSATGPGLEAAATAAAATASAAHGAAADVTGGHGLGVDGATPAAADDKAPGEAATPAAPAWRHEARAVWALADRDFSGELDAREYSQGVALVVGAWGNPLQADLPTHGTRPGDARWSFGAVETRSSAAPCEPGYFCAAGVRQPCPRGTWGKSAALDRPACDGPCAAGFWCPEQSTSPFGESSTSRPPRVAAHACGNASVFCAAGSREPQRAFTGYYTVGGADDGETRSSERRCPPGSYCAGDGVRRPCLKGFYGDGWGHTDRKCSGLCAAG
jgi:hypothetical protein